MADTVLDAATHGPLDGSATDAPLDGSAVARARFEREYRAVRRAEGWGSRDGAYYRALPYRDLSGRFARIWRIRARSFATFVERVLQPLEAEVGRALAVLDLGAGNAWLAYRLAQRGHRVLAIDLLTDPLDGLGAAKHYHARRVWPVQAEFDCLPLPGGTADLAIFNASLHYSPDCSATLREVLRSLTPSGRLVVLDTPFYRHAASGARMVAERQARFRRTYGFASDALRSEGYLTPRRLRQLGRELRLDWQLLQPTRTWRAVVGRSVTRLRLGRVPAEFPVIVGRRR
jgi:SAM-dependent methyltransferase